MLVPRIRDALAGVLFTELATSSTHVSRLIPGLEDRLNGDDKPAPRRSA
jgi:hypothetical protein